MNNTYIDRDDLCEVARDLIVSSICLVPGLSRDLRVTRVCCAISELIGIDVDADPISPEAFAVARAIRAAVNEVADQEYRQ